jgi:hypothetical protein
VDGRIVGPVPNGRELLQAIYPVDHANPVKTFCATKSNQQMTMKLYSILVVHNEILPTTVSIQDSHSDEDAF